MTRNKIMKLWILGLVILTIPIVSTFAKTASGLKERFLQKYSSASSVIATFKDQSGSVGNIWALKSGLYKLQLADRTIVCDGKNVWNISSADKTVIVNSYSTIGNDMVIDRIFFAAMNVYQAKVLVENKNGGKLTLTPPNTQARIGSISSIDVALNSSATITSLDINEFGSITKYALSRLQVNKKIPLNTFVYSAPKGWKVVDLR